MWTKDWEKIVPGTFSIRWNGKDQYQHSLSGGIYFVRTRTNNKVSQQKILFLK